MKFVLYTLLVTYRMIRVYVSSVWYLGFSLPASIYFNISLVLPLVMDYMDMIQKPIHVSKPLYFASAMVLLEDYLIDEQKRLSCKRFNLLTQKLYTYKHYTFSHTNENLLDIYTKLTHAQKHPCTDCTYQKAYDITYLKGLWFPLLALVAVQHIHKEQLQSIGFWMVCVDNYVDYKKDVHSGTGTLFTHPDFTADMGVFCTSYYQNYIKNADFEGINKKHIDRFLYRISRSTFIFMRYEQTLSSTPLLKQLASLAPLNICVFLCIVLWRLPAVARLS